MPNKLHHSDPIATAKRKSVAARRVGVGNQCVCGENRPSALIAGSKPMICAECKRRKQGLSVCDKHHVAGRANHQLTIPVPANDHRDVLSEDQYKWPKATRENRDHSPLLAMAACIRGLFATVVLLLKRLLLWIPELLEKLDACLTSYLGSKWWTRKEFADFIYLEYVE